MCNGYKEQKETREKSDMFSPLSEVSKVGHLIRLLDETYSRGERINSGDSKDNFKVVVKGDDLRRTIATLKNYELLLGLIRYGLAVWADETKKK